MKRKVVENCLSDRKLGKELGKGSHATVWQVGTTQALKVIQPRSVRKRAERELLEEVIKRELYIHRHAKLPADFAPPLIKTWTCNDATFILYPKYDGDMKQLGEKRAAVEIAKKNIPKSRIYAQVLLTVDELHRMFDLAKRLGQQYRVLHADLRIEQFFQKGGGKEILLGDYGFSGFFGAGKKPKYAIMGWHINEAEDEDKDDKLPPTAADIPRYLQAFNQYQLLADLTVNALRCYVRFPDGEIKILVGNKRLNKQFYDAPNLIRYVGLPRGFQRYRLPAQIFQS